MADIKLSIVNQALTAAGEDPLTTLTPGTVMANAAIENYDAIVGKELENGAWKFATTTATPTLMTALAATPLKYQWQMSSEAVEILAVLHCGFPLEGEAFDIAGRIVRTCHNTGITLKYLFRPDESVWPQRFRRIIVQRLEALFLRVTERHSEAAERDQDTSVLTLVAKHTEARQSANRPLDPGSLARARLGDLRRRSF